MANLARYSVFWCDSLAISVLWSDPLALEPISPYISSRFARSYSIVGFLLCQIAHIMEISFYVLAMKQRGGADLMGVTATSGALLSFFVNALHCHQKAFNPQSVPLARDCELDDARITGVSYLRLKGMDVIALNQEAQARQHLQTISHRVSMRTFKEETVKNVFNECITAHFLIGLLPTVISAVNSCWRMKQRGEVVMSVLAAGAVWSKTCQAFILVQVAFSVRLAQVLSEFEIRRVEADVRVVTPNLVHRITPRFKSLLHECHMIGNLCHPLLYTYAPISIIYIIQLIAGVFLATAGGSNDTCVPAWAFAGVFQPLVTIMIYIHCFGKLNLAIERDVDQDVVEMNIRLTFSDSHVPNWLLQQMICLERLDGRAFSLPFDIVPSVEMSRRIFSNSCTVSVFLAPFLFQIMDKLSGELLCPKEEYREVYS